MKHFIFVSIICLVLVGCRQKAALTLVPGDDTVYSQAPTASIHYSELLQLDDVEYGTLCRVRDPWRSGNIVKQYLLVPNVDTTWNESKLRTMEQSYGPSIILRTPLKRNTLTTACHAWLLSQLNALAQVAVMCDTMYVKADVLRSWLNEGKVINGGTAIAPNAEVILAANSDAIWVSPYENMGLGNLAQLPVPVIYCADYLETSPLARAEWMKFYGRLVGREAEADALFARVAEAYEQEAVTTSNGKSLFAELPYGATWYVPGGCSTSSLLYQDAGYTYPWSEDLHAGSLSLSKEAVIARAANCDVWLFKYNNEEGEWSLQSFLAQDEIYSQFQAARNGNVWGCNTAVSDFFDVTPFRPDTLLHSLRVMDGHFFQQLR